MKIHENEIHPAVVVAVIVDRVDEKEEHVFLVDAVAEWVVEIEIMMDR